MTRKILLAVIFTLVGLNFGLLVSRTDAQMQLHALTRLTPHTFKDLSMADMTEHGAKLTDGYITYCSDCSKPTIPGVKCAGGGPGAEAHRIRGQWSCF